MEIRGPARSLGNKLPGKGQLPAGRQAGIKRSLALIEPAGVLRRSHAGSISLLALIAARVGGILAGSRTGGLH